MEQLYKKLVRYGESDYYPFHMPGHKRNMGSYEQSELYRLDITEIEGFDNLHHAEGILAEDMKKAASLYQSEETFYLVNGSTCGILSTISATVNWGETLLISRNSHKAAYNAIALRHLKSIYLYPKVVEEYAIYGGIDPQDVERELQSNSKIKAVMVTSPTVDGIVSDIETIANICHRYEKPLIVDEAHGAHFGFDKDFPQTSVHYGADIVIHSVHKTLPSLTQTAILHINGTLVNREKLKQYLAIYQTSSPSYLLMGSIGQCISILERQSKQLFSDLKENLAYFKDLTSKLSHIKIMNQAVCGKNSIKALDAGKIIISVKETTMTGPQLYDILLNRFHLQLEMAMPTYALAIVTIMDTRQGMERLGKALQLIDKEIGSRAESISDIMQKDFKPKKKYDIFMAQDKEKEELLLKNSKGRVSGEFVYLYPPGIPLLVPGEVITEEVMQQIYAYRKNGLSVQGLSDYSGEKIKVCSTKSAKNNHKL